MRIADLVQSGGSWLTPDGAAETVVSSRVRLARNLREAAFPGWAGEEECARIWEQARDILLRLPSMQPAFAVAMHEVGRLDRQILFERRLISREQAEKGRGSGLVSRRDEVLGAMVNEEDHLRLQALHEGLDLQGAWESVDRLDSEIEAHLPYAFSARLGYLTACPSNVGTGMRASVMMHLPGLVLMNEMNAIVKGLNKIGLTVRGLWGEGTEAAGNMFQISNQITLGEPEREIVVNLEQIVREVVEHEENARDRLRGKRETLLRDAVGRAYGILANAHVLTSKEALNHLSGLWLGLDLGILASIELRTVHELMLLTQPGHLQEIAGSKLSAKERDTARASLVREKLAAPIQPKKPQRRRRKTHE
jgi:protein arginine kinase